MQTLLWACLLASLPAAGGAEISWDEAPAAAARLVKNISRSCYEDIPGDEDEDPAEPGDPRDLPRFAQVAPGIYRSGQPRRAAFAKIQELGIRTLLSIRRGINEIEEEEAKRLGIELISIPMPGSRCPSFAQVDRALSVLMDPSKRPILVHCKHGKDRTGVAVAAYRVIAQGWDPAAAAAEAKSFGCCGPFWGDLADYLKRYREHRSLLPLSVP